MGGDDRHGAGCAEQHLGEGGEAVEGDPVVERGPVVPDPQQRRPGGQGEDHDRGSRQQPGAPLLEAGAEEQEPHAARCEDALREDRPEIGAGNGVVDGAHGTTALLPLAFWDPEDPEDVLAFAAPWMASRTEGSMRERNGRG